MKPKPEGQEKLEHKYDCTCFVTEDGCSCAGCGGMNTCNNECQHCTPSGQAVEEDWEKDLKLYLTSAGDRRRTIAFIRTLLQQKEQEVAGEIIKMTEIRIKDLEYEWSLKKNNKKYSKLYLACLDGMLQEARSQRYELAKYLTKKDKKNV